MQHNSTKFSYTSVKCDEKRAKSTPTSVATARRMDKLSWHAPAESN